MAFPGDVRLSSCGSLVSGVNIFIAKTFRKTHRMQFVAITYPNIVVYLVLYKTKKPQQRLFVQNVSLQAYLQTIKSAAVAFKIPNSKITTHSARICMATEDYINEVSIERIAINGRWKLLASMRYYLDIGKSWILNMI